MITSYAQNFEDVILWRALKHIGPGFYIDIGAYDPVIDSISLCFYEQGWRGVHIEPCRASAEKLRTARPDERVIEAAIGTRENNIPFWEVSNTGLSTGDPALATLYEASNRKVVRIEVPCMRLSRLLTEYRDIDIHWLKIDAEGMEHEVIESWRPAQARPWIVVVESTKPNSREPIFSDWEPLLSELGYEYAYFDGINRFYVSREREDLKKHFGPGPNLFDGFFLSGHSPFCARLRQETMELEARVMELEARVKSLKAELATIYRSTFWRLTAPLRGVDRSLRRMARNRQP